MTIDANTRCEIHDLLARFAHYLDHGMASQWVKLFKPDATMDYLGETLRLCELPAFHEQVRGANRRRHVITGIVIDPGASRRQVTVHASGFFFDLEQGARGDFYDYRFDLYLCTYWRIARVSVIDAGSDGQGSGRRHPGLADSNIALPH